MGGPHAMAYPDEAVPLSDSERQRFEDIERTFDDADPRKGNNSLTTLRRRSGVRAGTLFAVGMMALIGGLAEAQNAAAAGICVSVAGFLIMAWAVTRFPRFRSVGPPNRRR